jgi:hypothetical protein
MNLRLLGPPGAGKGRSRDCAKARLTYAATGAASNDNAPRSSTGTSAPTTAVSP